MTPGCSTAERGGYALDAQWMDDYHHAAHAFFSGERHGYYSDFGEALQLRRVLEQPYLYAGNTAPIATASMEPAPRDWPATGLSFACKTTIRSAIGPAAIG